MAQISYDEAVKQGQSMTVTSPDGRAANMHNTRPFQPDTDFSIGGYNNDYINVEELYVAANGNLYQDCDASYERVDDESEYTINDMDTFKQHLIDLAEGID